MKLQLAIDEYNSKTAYAVEKVSPFVDIIEVGTPFLLNFGCAAVKQLKNKYPGKEILCDAKIADAGDYEAGLAFNAGADYVTVLGMTDSLTIKACVTEAKKRNKKLVVDLLCVKDFAMRIPEIESLGIDVFAVHTGADQQHAGNTPLQDLKQIKHYVKHTPIAVAGGINRVTIEQYVAQNPNIVIVGSGILNAVNPAAEAEGIKAAMTQKI